jgi:hypothetical protein
MTDLNGKLRFNSNIRRNVLERHLVGPSQINTLNEDKHVFTFILVDSRAVQTLQFMDLSISLIAYYTELRELCSVYIMSFK